MPSRKRTKRKQPLTTASITLSVTSPQASQLGSFLAPFYEGESSLYKDSVSNNYYMILRKAESHEDAFHRACNIAADFGVRISASYATPAYFREHFQTILAENAIEMLCELV